MYRKSEEEMEFEVAKFEQNMFIMNPAMYQEYMRNKEEQQNNGNANITWAAPESMEEARELMNIFSDIEQQIRDDKDPEADKEFAKQVDFMAMLGGINLDEIGGDE